MIRTSVGLGWKSIPGHRHRVEGRENEDAAFASRDHPYFDAVMIVSDGMGGHPEPRLAAQTAAAAARDFLFAAERGDELSDRRADIVALLDGAAQYANSRVRRLAVSAKSAAASVSSDASPAAWSDEKLPGCTLMMAVVFDGRLVAANVGDGSIFLYREGCLSLVAGGEGRRIGSRPEEFLGRGDRVTVETVRETAEKGDRIVLCTDGLTRYFGSGGASTDSESLERLRQVVGRTSADAQALASQLTADGRGELYDDDTTVVIADIGASREVTDHAPRHRDPRKEEISEMEAAPRSSARRRSSRPLLLPIGVGCAALAAALFLWRPWERSPEAAKSAFQPFTAPAVDLSALPRGGVVLVHRETGLVYVLRTRPVGPPPADEPIPLSVLRVQPGKSVEDTGNSYRLDVARGRLIANGHTYPVTIDGSTGVIEIQQGAALRLNTKPTGLPVFIDGLSAGRTPASISVRAGRHQVQVRGRSGRALLWDVPVDIPPGATFVLSQDFSARSGGRVPHP